MFWQLVLAQLTQALQPVVKKVLDQLLKNLGDQLTRGLPPGTLPLSSVSEADKEAVVNQTLKDLFS